MVHALSDNPGTVIHQNREVPIRLPDQDYTTFFDDAGGIVCQASKPVTQQYFQDRRIYGEYL